MSFAIKSTKRVSHNFTIFGFWRSKVQNWFHCAKTKWSRAVFLVELQERIRFLAFSTAGGCQHSLAKASLPIFKSSSTASSYLTLIHLSLSFLCDYVAWAHWIISRLGILNLIISTKLFLTYKGTYSWRLRIRTQISLRESLLFCPLLWVFGEIKKKKKEAATILPKSSPESYYSHRN